tara:strand:+ start:1494 stop:1847 length:354 start_codon:yes stop_codon:yes gene_type:complete
MDNQTTYYKYDEIKNELLNYVENNNLTLSEALEDDDLHFKVYNSDYFIIGYYNAEQWLIKDDTNYTFEVLEYVQERSEEMFGTIIKITDAERLVNLYAFWLGYDVIAELQAEQEEEE